MGTEQLRAATRTLRIAICLTAIAGCGACIRAGTPPDPWSGWTRLEFKAGGAALFSGSLEMNRTRETDSTVLETRTVARFLGARIASSRSWSRYDGEAGLPVEYRSLTRKRGRRYRFDERGYVVERLSPDAGPEAPIDQWGVTSSEEFAYPEDDSGHRRRPYDYFGMLLHLRDSQLDRPGDEVTMLVATSRGPRPFRVVVAEERHHERVIRDLSSGEKSSRRIHELRLRVIPADPRDSDEGFLRMEGETELWVEARSKALLEIGGKVPKVPGRVRIVLRAMG